jgi:hypothetical protein
LFCPVSLIGSPDLRKNIPFLKSLSPGAINDGSRHKIRQNLIRSALIPKLPASFEFEMTSQWNPTVHLRQPARLPFSTVLSQRGFYHLRRTYEKTPGD